MANGLVYVRPPETIELAAGEEKNFPAFGNFVRCTENNGDSFLFSFENDPWIALTAGQAQPLAPGSRPYEYLRFKNPNASAIEIEIRYGMGNFEDNRLKYTGAVDVQNKAGTILATKENVPDTLTTAADQAIVTATKTSVAAVNLNRVEVIVQNLEATGGANIRVGDTNTGAARGTQIAPGGSAVLTTTAEIFVYHAKGSDLNVSVTEIERS